MNSCPSTTAFMQSASKKLNCTRPKVYHCVPDQQNRLTEICVRRSWIQAGHCPEYSEGAKSLSQKTCISTRGICPKYTYWSNEASSYSACTFTKRDDSKDIITESDDTAVASIVIPISIIILVICSVIGVAVYICKRRRQLADEGKDEENVWPLLQQGDHRKTSEEKRKEQHLEKEEASLKYFEYKGTCTKYMLKTTTEHLQNNQNVIIVGKPGSGKTTLAWTVCKQMHGEMSTDKRWHVTVSADTDNIPKGNDMILFLLDGRFESAWTTEETVGEILEEVEEFEKKLPTMQVAIMVTMSQHAYRRIEKYDLIQKLKPFHIIDLDDEKNSLNIVEMGKVFETYDIFIQNVNEASDHNVLSKDQLRSVYDCFQHDIFAKTFNSTPKLGFPLIATLMALNKTFRGNIDFVTEPIKYVVESVKQLRKSGKKDDNNRYCTIVYAVFNGGYVDMNNVNKDMMQKIGSNHNIQEPDIDTNFYLLRKKTDVVCEFVHMSLLQAILAAYGRMNLGFVVKHCRLDVLLEHIALAREIIPDTERPFYLIIGGTEYEKSLAKRIIHENVDIRHHRIWKQRRFQEMYMECYRMTMNRTLSYYVA